AVDDGLLFSGDTLFASGWGRTDLPGGSDEEIVESLIRLSELEPPTAVLPGPGPETTIRRELPWLELLRSTQRPPFSPDLRRRTAARRLPVHEPGGVDDLEHRAGDPVEGVEVVVVPARIGRAGDVVGRAVVGEDHPVLLQGPEDDLALRSERADV